MASPTILDFDRLLTPISGDNPCGADLRWEPVYQQIKDERPKEDKDAFGLETSDIGSWPSVLDLTSDALATQSKDMMIAAWLCESLVHVHGFAGLRDGLRFYTDLLEQFWDGIYPLPDGEDLEPRIGPIVFLAKSGSGAKLPNMLRETPLTPDRGEEIFSFNYWRARQPMPGEPAEVFAQRAVEVGEKTRKFDEAVGRMSKDVTRNLYEDLEAASEELKRLNKCLDAKFGSMAPGTTELRTALEECHHRVRLIYKEKGGFDEAAEEAGSDEAASTENGQSSGPGGPIRTREDAFRRLAEVATFLRQKEPQNPIYLLVERAVLWSRMPFEQLLSELVKDSGARGQVVELLGIKEPTEGSS